MDSWTVTKPNTRRADTRFFTLDKGPCPNLMEVTLYDGARGISTQNQDTPYNREMYQAISRAWVDKKIKKFPQDIRNLEKRYVKGAGKYGGFA